MTWMDRGRRTAGVKPKHISTSEHCDKCDQILRNCVCDEIKRKRREQQNVR